MKRESFIKIARKNGDSIAINLPAEVVKLLEIKEGDMMRVEIEKVTR